MGNTNRRGFIKKASIAAAGLGAGSLLASCGTDEQKSAQGAAPVNTGKTYEWKMVTAWPPHFPILGTGAERVAKRIEEMSGGRIKIHVYGGGELIPALESFDAVRQGVVQMCHSASYYWAGKSPAAQLFTSVPFGMNTQQTNAWFFNGGGLDLWREVYDSFNLVPFPCGNTGGQMGGWFNKEINSPADLKGLKIRTAGLGAKVYTKAGASAILVAGGEIYTNLERGVIDATDWVGPYHDYQMGFHDIAKYYYYPGWQEPTGVVEMIVNKGAYNQLPGDLKTIVEQACLAENLLSLADFDARNEEYLTKLKSDGTELKRFPESVMKEFKQISEEVITELTAQDAMSKKVYDSYKSFQNEISKWNNVNEHNYGAAKS